MKFKHAFDLKMTKTVLYVWGNQYLKMYFIS